MPSTKKTNTKSQTAKAKAKKSTKKKTAKRSSSKKKPVAKKKATKKKSAAKKPAKKKATKRKATTKAKTALKGPTKAEWAATHPAMVEALKEDPNATEMEMLSGVWDTAPDVSDIFNTDYGTTSSAASIRPPYSGPLTVGGKTWATDLSRPAREMAPIIDGTDPYGIQALHAAWVTGTPEGRAFIRVHELRDAFPSGCIRISHISRWMEKNGWHKLPVIVIEGVTLFSRTEPYEGPPEPQLVPPKVTFLCINDLQHPRPSTPEYHRDYGRHISKLLYELAIHHEMDTIDLVYLIADKDRPTEPGEPVPTPTPLGYIVSTMSTADIVRKEQPNRLVVERTAQETAKAKREELLSLNPKGPPLINVKKLLKEPEPSSYALGKCSECSTPFATVPYTSSIMTDASFSIGSAVACQLCAPLIRARVEKKGGTFTRMEVPKPVPVPTHQEKVAYKILPLTLWAGMRDSVPLVRVDGEDGYMHMSTAQTVQETARKHFSGHTNLVLLEIDLSLVHDLRWESGRGGHLFPHAYGAVPINAVTQWGPLPEKDGVFVFPTWVLKR